MEITGTRSAAKVPSIAAVHQPPSQSTPDSRSASDAPPTGASFDPIPSETVPAARPSDADEKNRRPIVALALLLCGSALLYGVGLGATDLWAPDEPRYAAIAEELRSFRHGIRGWVLLHLNDTVYNQKPPLYFWIAALFGTPSGRVTELAARAPSAIAGVASVALTAWIGRVLLGRWASGLLAAALLATSFRFVFSARRAGLDVLLCFFELGAIALFLLLEKRRGGLEKAREAPTTLLLLHASLGAAALVKGPVGWLPLGVFVAFLAWEKRTEAIRALFPVWAPAVTLGPLLLWALAAWALAPPGFAEAAVGDNLIGRFFSGSSHARPFYYFLYQLPLDFLPWSLLLPFALPLVWRAATSPSSVDLRNPDRALSTSDARLLLCWILVPLLFFSLSAGKRGVYLLPVFPAFALVAVLGGRFFADPAQSTGILRERLFRPILAVALLECVLFWGALPWLDTSKSPRPIALAAAMHTAEGDRLGVFGMTPIEGALSYYGGPPIVSLRKTEDLVEFLNSGGQMVLLRSRHLAELGAELNLDEVASFRSGDRRLSLAKISPAILPMGYP